MKPVLYRQIIQWLLNIGMLEYRRDEKGKLRRFPTDEGEAIGLQFGHWNDRDVYSPTVSYSEESQRFVIDNLDAVIATTAKKARPHIPGA